MMPDKATIWMCGIEDSEYKEKRLDFWNDVYGFDMSCVRYRDFFFLYVLHRNREKLLDFWNVVYDDEHTASI